MFLLLKPVEYQTIKRIASWTCDKKNCKHNEIDKCQFTLWEHCIVNIKECNSH